MSLENAVGNFEMNVYRLLNDVCEGSENLSAEQATSAVERLRSLASGISAVSNAKNTIFPNELTCQILEWSLKFKMTHEDRKILYDTLSCICVTWRSMIREALPLPIAVNNDAVRSLCWSLSRLSGTKPTNMLWLHWSPVTVTDPCNRVVHSIGHFTPIPKERPSTFRYPRIPTSKLAKLVTLLTERKAFLENIDLHSGVEVMVGWRSFLEGDLPSLKSLRIWKDPFGLEILSFSADLLRILHLKRCIPPLKSFPNLTEVVLHGLMQEGWKCGDLLDFLRFTPALETVKLEGQVARDTRLAEGRYIRVLMPRLVSIRINAINAEGSIMVIFDRVLAPLLKTMEWCPIDGISKKAFADRTKKTFTTVVSPRPNDWWGATLRVDDTLILGKWPLTTADGSDFCLEKTKRLYLDSLHALFTVNRLPNILMCFPYVAEIHISTPMYAYGRTGEWHTIMREALKKNIQVFIYNCGNYDTKTSPFPDGVALYENDWSLTVT